MNSVKSVGSGRQFLLSGMSLAIMSLMSAGAASAQETPATAGEPQQAVCPTPADPDALCAPEETASAAAGGDMEEIIVRGVRGSVTSAISAKQNSAQITDSIIAEDIGKLPDNSVAEALQRVSGVQVARGQGEVNLVLIRGLPNIVTTINGRNVFTTTGRGIALADIPADLLKQVDVYKTSSPEHIEGGIAGMIDVGLRRPFDFDPGWTVAGGIRGVYSDQSEKTDPIGSLTINNRWDTDIGEMGAMASVSYQDRNYNLNNTFNGTYDFIPNPLDPDQMIYRPFVIGAIYTLGERERTSSNISLQWRPNDRTELYFDGFYVSYENNWENNFWIPLPGLANADNITDITLKPGGTITRPVRNGAITTPQTGSVVQTLQATNMHTLTSNQAFADSSDTYQAAFGGKWKGDWVTIDSDIAYTFSEADNRAFILDTAFNAPLLTVNYSNDGAADALVTNADGSFFDVTDSSHYALEQFFDRRSHQEGEDVSWMTNFNFVVDAGPITTVDAGFRLSNRTATNQAVDTGGLGNISGAPIMVDDFDGLADITPGNLLDGERAVSTPRWMIANREYLLNNTDAIREAMGYAAGGPGYMPSLFFDDTEDNYAGYAQANYEFSLGSMTLDGLFGARVVKLESELNGTQRIDDVESPLSIDKSETEVLPTISARLKILDDLFLRAVGSKSITRPDFAQLNPNLTLFQATPTGPASGSGGNPNLDSVESTNYDLSLEWYFTKSAQLSAAGFYRDLKGYIQTYSALEPIGGTDYIVSRPRNTGDGTLQGVELAYTQFFDFLPGFLSGFGLQLNATFIDAETEAVNPATGEITGEMQKLVNVSDEAYNAILLYDLDAFSARLAYNWRSEYAATYNECCAQPASVYFAPIQTVDYAMNYDVNDRLTLSLEITNLFDDAIENYFGGESGNDDYLFPRDIVATERTFSLGLRFRL